MPVSRRCPPAPAPVGHCRSWLCRRGSRRPGNARGRPMPNSPSPGSCGQHAAMSPVAEHDHLHLCGEADERRYGAELNTLLSICTGPNSPVLSSAVLIAEEMKSRARCSCHCLKPASAAISNHSGKGASTTWTRLSGTFRSAASRPPTGRHPVPLLSHQRLPRPRHVVVATFQFFSDRLSTHRQHHSGRPRLLGPKRCKPKDQSTE